MRYILISLYTFVAWEIHLAIVALYLPRFSDLKSIGFRVVHAIEIALVMLVLFTVYFRTTDDRPSVGMIITAVIVILGILDTILFVSSEAVRSKFDVFHFIVAFTSVAVAIVTASSMKS